ncbi:MAG TPA: hypothetical protein VGR40_03095 [Candidatus Binatus sp.]|nr:hypothetical protein [Candidatus Binatus sp.]
MTLTDAQIDRYSRQIIVPHIGGRGQERLLNARLLLVGDARDIETPLAYLVGAGVGTIYLSQSGERLISGAHELNSDVMVKVADKLPGDADLALLIVGSDAVRQIAIDVANSRSRQALVLARLDDPGKIAITPTKHSHIETSVFAEFGARSDAADFVAMLATVEAFKLLAGYDENPAPAIIEFDGYATAVRALS